MTRNANPMRNAVKKALTGVPKLIKEVNCLLGVCPLHISRAPIVERQIKVESVGGFLVIKVGPDAEMRLIVRTPESADLKATSFVLQDTRLYFGGSDPVKWQELLAKELRLRRLLTEYRNPEGIPIQYGQLWAATGIASGAIFNYRGLPTSNHWSNVVRGNATWRNAFGFATVSERGRAVRALAVPKAIYEGLVRLLEKGYPPLVPIWWSGMIRRGGSSSSKLISGDGIGFNGNWGNPCYGSVHVTRAHYLYNSVAGAWSRFRRGEATCELAKNETIITPPERFFELFVNLMEALLQRRLPDTSGRRATTAQLACQGLPTYAETSRGKGFWCHPWKRPSRLLKDLLFPREEILRENNGFIEVEAKLGLDEVLGGQWVEEPSPNLQFHGDPFVRLLKTNIVRTFTVDEAKLGEWRSIADSDLRPSRKMMGLLHLALGNRRASYLIRRKLLFGLFPNTTIRKVNNDVYYYERGSSFWYSRPYGSPSKQPVQHPSPNKCKPKAWFQGNTISTISFADVNIAFTGVYNAPSSLS